MSVTRTQFLRNLVVSFPDATETTFDLFGPETAAEPPYAENTDHVTRPRQVRENEAGVVQVDIPSTLRLATVWLRSVEVWDKKSLPGQRGLDPALFPTGATPGGSAQAFKRTIFDADGANVAALNDAATLAILGGSPMDADTDKHTPLLSVGADEFLKISIFNGSGGALNNQNIKAKYDLGLNPAVGGSQP